MLLTDKKTQALAALSIGLICVVIGLPVWWKTTEVYRVHLPYSDIASLENLQASKFI
jgi:phosphatidylinositol glycan class S